MGDRSTRDVLARLRRRKPQYAEPAYVFILTALHHRMEQLDKPRHLSGAELADSVRELALARFGPLARTVLEYWGIHSTSDMGEIVFALVECGVLIKQPEDRREDFEGLFNFEDAFERRFPWSATTGG